MCIKKKDPHCKSKTAESLESIKPTRKCCWRNSLVSSAKRAELVNLLLELKLKMIDLLKKRRMEREKASRHSNCTKSSRAISRAVER